ncbi:MAG TPA: undecaprenyl-phosphate glucose phosphotransferase [Porticoccaceae bacterium]|nr:undecaprenyl-phosphate glucose phosphotransferase [Porticoccaceae bacterium]
MGIVDHRSTQGLTVLLLVTDLALLILTAYGAFFTRFGNFDVPDFYHLAITSAVLLAALALIVDDSYAGFYTIPLRKQYVDLLLRYLLAFGFFTLLLVFLKISERYSRVWLATWIVSSFLLLMLARAFFHYLLRHYRASGRFLRHVLLLYRECPVGRKESGSEDLVDNLSDIDGYRICETIAMDAAEFRVEDLPALIDAGGIDEVWITTPLQDSKGLEDISYALRHSLVEIRFMPQLAENNLLRHRISQMGPMYSIDLSYTPLDGMNRVIKRSEDIVLASIIGILIIPVCILIAIAIKLTSKGPVLFKQYRQGINGKKIKVYKFRSMEVHEEQGKVTQATRDDDRISWLGRFLRRTSLDELPQFYNVIQGRMSIVGPRPHALVHNEYYKDLVESYMWRHKIRPGITGWAQINGFRGETDTLEKMKQRVEHDLWYIDNWSLGLDLRIIFCTLYKGFIHPNAY